MTARLKFASLSLILALIISFIPAAALQSHVSAASTCDWAQFVSDVTVPDGAKYDPGATFKKTWRLKNIGTCTWTTSYSLVFDTGEKMGLAAPVPFSASVAPGQTIDLTADMTAPGTAGHYIGYWKLKNSSGVLFGIGTTANKSFWVDINVTSKPVTNIVYDFTEKAANATWSNSAGVILTTPGPDGDPRGFWLTGSNWTYEDNTVPKSPILVAPQNITNGYIQAVYPDFKVQTGDIFKTQVGCELSATTCYVQFSLAYQIGSGSAITIWRFNEKWDRLTKPADFTYPDIKLDDKKFGLVGKDVKFILRVSANGSPTGDRAIWGNPVIVRKGSVPPPPTVTGTPPTATPTNTPGPITVTVPPSSCDKVDFVKDVSIPDGTVVAPGATFTKTWRLKNVGSCAWSTSYQLVFFSGEKMGADSSANFTKNVAVGETADFSINMTAPLAAKSYRGYWMFKNANGALFGWGPKGNSPWWVDIKVSGPTVTPGGPTKTPTPTVTPGGPSLTPTLTQVSGAGTAYDFAANACAGTWFSGSGQLACPGTDGDAKGFVLKVSNPKLETGTTDTRAGILTFPQNVQNGYIQGFFPPFKVQSGDHFQSVINCDYNATSCYVAFRLDYQTGSDPIKTFWGPFLEKYEGKFYTVDVDLTKLAGKDVKFILTVLSAGAATGDRALWVGPRIYRPGSSPVTNTPTPGTAANIYQNTKYGFKFTLPTGAKIASQADNTGRVDLPIASGTNLQEKYIQVNVVEGANPCISPAVGGSPASSGNETINNIQFLKQTGQEGAAGNIYDWVAYSTTRNNACISLAFILHSVNPGNYPTPPPVFDKAAESAVFTTIMSAFNWTNP